MILFQKVLSNSSLLFLLCSLETTTRLGTNGLVVVRVGGRHSLSDVVVSQQQQEQRLWRLQGKEDDDDENDPDVDYDRMLPKDPTQGKSLDPSLGQWNVPKKEEKQEQQQKQQTRKLGIDVGSFLAPLSNEEADELKAAATEVINEAIASGIDEMEMLRAKMKLELEFQKDNMQRQSERNAEQASQELLGRIDDLTNAFLANTTAFRTSTRLAAQADRAMEGRGVDMGTWGTLGGASVVTGMSTSTSSCSSSSSKTTGATTSITPRSNRLLIVADTKDDVYAKQLIEPLTKALEQVVSSLEVQTIRPTETWPLGGQNAAAVIVFLTSLNDASTVKNGLARLMRQTVTAGGQLAHPPTQIVAISTIGTARTNQMPYSMQNLFGGKLEKRKQMEEAVQLYVEQIAAKTRPPFLDYTICKLGELKSDNNKKESLTLAPGDVLDGTIPVDAAVAVLKQAIALQPAARNATFSSVGTAHDLAQDEWDDLFLPLDGPELWRTTAATTTRTSEFDQLVEYLQEWCELPSTSQGLTTPIRIELSPLASLRKPLPIGVKRQVPLQLLFLPTATGARYMSRGEEKERERLFDQPAKASSSSPSSSSSSSSRSSSQRTSKEGGLELLVEETIGGGGGGGQIRVRVRRCNYAPGVILKELTEQTLLSRIKKTISVWQKDHSSSS